MFRGFFKGFRRRAEADADSCGAGVPHRLPDDLRVYAVGDIHGRADLLASLEERIAAHAVAFPHAGRSLVIFLGDYVDRGSGSRDVVERLSRPGFAGLPARYLRGNHEDAMLRFLSDSAEGGEWLAWGGMATLASYGVPAQLSGGKAGLAATRRALARVLPATHLDFLSGLELAIELGGYLFVHAGVRPGVALAAQRREDLLEIREPFLNYNGHLAWRVVHGHTVFPEPVFEPGRISLDTGAYASGRLSCAVIEGEEATLLPT